MRFFRNAIILVVIGLLAGFTYWYFEVKKAKEKKEKEAKEALLFGQSSKDIVKIVFKESGKKPVTVERREKEIPKEKKKKEGAEKKVEWVVTTPVKTGGDTYTIDEVVRNIHEGKREEVVWENISKAKEYGLDKPSFSLRFYYKGDTTPYGIDFGIESLDKKRVFARVLGEDKIYSVLVGVRDSFKKSLFDVRDKRISPYEKDDVVGVALMSGKSVFDLKKEGKEWYFVRDHIKASDSRVDLFTGDLRWGSFKEVVAEKATKKDLEKYGLDKPRLIIRFKLKNGGSYFFIVGNPVKEGNVEYYYATRSTDGLVFKVTADLVNRLNRTKFYLKDRHIFNFAYDDVVGLTLKKDSKSFTFKKVGNDWQFADTKKKVEKGFKLDGIVRSLAEAEYQEREPIKRGDPMYAKTGIEHPKYHVILKFKDNRKPITVDLTEKNEKTQRLYLTPDGGNTVYYTEGYLVSNFPDKRKDLEKSD